MPHRPRTRSLIQRLTLAATAAAVSITLASCTTTEDPTGSGTRSSTTHPSDSTDRDEPSRTNTDTDVDFVEGGAELAPQLAALRSLDPCALLDPVAGEQATGAVAKTLAPTRDMSECDLELVGETDQDDWTITATLGARFDDLSRSDGDTTTIGGVTFYTSPPTRAGCRLTLAVQPNYGIELSVRAWADAPGREPCDVARTVVKAAPERWAPLPQRADNHTAPHLPLAPTINPRRTRSRTLGLLAAREENAATGCAVTVQPIPGRILRVTYYTDRHRERSCDIAELIAARSALRLLDSTR